MGAGLRLKEVNDERRSAVGGGRGCKSCCASRATLPPSWWRDGPSGKLGRIWERFWNVWNSRGTQPELPVNARSQASLASSHHAHRGERAWMRKGLGRAGSVARRRRCARLAGCCLPRPPAPGGRCTRGSRPPVSGVRARGTGLHPLLLEYGRGTLDSGDYRAKFEGYRRYDAAREWEDHFPRPPTLLVVCGEQRAGRGVRRAALGWAGHAGALTTTVSRIDPGDGTRVARRCRLAADSRPPPVRRGEDGLDDHTRIAEAGPAPAAVQRHATAWSGAAREAAHEG